MNQQELEDLIRTEPTIAATFADLDAEYQAAMAHVNSLTGKHNELKQKLHAIAEAKEELAALVSKPEPAPVDTPAEREPPVDPTPAPEPDEPPAVT